MISVDHILFGMIIGLLFVEKTSLVILTPFLAISLFYTSDAPNDREPHSHGQHPSPRAMTDTTLPEPSTESGTARLIVGITGASGVIYGVRLLEILKTTPIETHLILSDSGRLALGYETNLKPRDIEALATAVHPFRDVAACVSSGSFATLGMVIAPCSMRSLAEIATGVTASLLTRAADVVLKERRRLVLVAREAPLNLVHLRNMTTVTEMGGIVFPPVPAFYARPASLDEMVDYTVRRVLDLFGIDNTVAPIPRWGEQLGRKPKDKA